MKTKWNNWVADSFQYTTISLLLLGFAFGIAGFAFEKKENLANKHQEASSQNVVLNSQNSSKIKEDKKDKALKHNYFTLLPNLLNSHYFEYANCHE